MKIPTWMIGLSLPALAFAAHAQDVPAPPSDAPVAQPAPPSDVPPPADDSLGPQSGAPDAAVPPAPPPPDAGPPPPPGAPQVVMGSPSPVVQQAPPPPSDYPKCTRTVKDGCENPGGQ